MSKLIYAETLKEAWRKKHNIGEDDLGAVFVGYTEIPRLIDEQQPVDAVEVIRCKDCKYYKKTSDGLSYCHDHDDDILWQDDDFCSRAERRTDE